MAKTNLTRISINNGYSYLTATPEVTAKLLPLLALCGACTSEWDRAVGESRMVETEPSVEIHLLTEAPMSKDTWESIKEAARAEAEAALPTAAE